MMILNFRATVERNCQISAEENAYLAYVPDLGVATDGDTAKEVLISIQEIASMFLQSLRQDGLVVPKPAL